MNLTRVYAIVLRHYFLAHHQLERLFDIFFFPVFALVVWGFLSQYVSYIQASTLGAFLLGGIILWIIFERVGTDIGISFMFDIWERNIINVLSTPLTFLEYLTGLVLICIFKIMISFVAMWIVAALFYNFQIMSLGLPLALFFINLVIFATSFGLFNITMVLRFGHSIGPLTWILPFCLQPFVAVFYPISVLPPALQNVSYFIPISYVFEGMRQVISTGQFDATLFWKAFILNIIYFALSVGFFAFILKIVLKSGRLVKLT